MLNRILWILRIGVPWRDLPERFGPWQSVCHDFNQGRKDGVFDQKSYRRRNVVERCQGRLKECRRIATRREKPALNFLAMLKLAVIEQYLRYEL
jgi:transposase